MRIKIKTVTNKLMNFIKEEKYENSFKPLTLFNLPELDEYTISTILEVCNITKTELLYYYKNIKKYLNYNEKITYEIFWNSMADLGYPLARCRWGVFHEKLFEAICTGNIKYMNVYECLLAISILQKRCSSVDFYQFILKSIFLTNVNINVIYNTISDLGNPNDYFPYSSITIDMIKNLFCSTFAKTNEFYDLVFGWNP